MELTYTKRGDYLLPDLKLPQNPNLGKYAMMRRSYLKESRSGLYTGMMISGRLNTHLTEVEQQAQAMMERLLTQLAKAEGVTEMLKATDQMLWVQRMNSIRTRAEEIVRSQLICS